MLPGGEPCGKTCTRMEKQAELLRREGVPMKDEDHVDLKNAAGTSERSSRRLILYEVRIL